MCGICGYLGDPYGLDPAAMLDALDHRGPDGRGEFRRPTQDGELWLGHTRLSIIDLSPTGAQPMSTPDGVHTIVYNGEIYNHRALREDLKSRGYQFRGTSDTEVLLYLLREEGVAGIDRLRGMFAFAFWDAEKQALLIARDPYGIKPLYYLDTPRRLSFASELRALLRGHAAEPRLNPVGIESYLAFGCVMRPHTIIRDIRCLIPGSLVQRRVGEDRCREARHYSFPAQLPDQPKTYGEAVERVSATLRRVVEEHMVADVPVGVLLSGGIDSSGLVALLASDGLTPDTFSVIFSDADESMSEAPYSAAVSRRFGTRHHEVRTSENVADGVREGLAALDQPSIDGANTYLVCTAVRNAGITVVQSGLGADEVFVGYGTHRTVGRLQWLSALARLPGMPAAARAFGVLPWTQARYPLGKLLGFLATEGSLADAYGAARGLFPEPTAAHLLGRLPASSSSFLANGMAELRDLASRVSLLEIGNYMGNMLLRDSDAMSMAHGLELRVPYLDRDLVEQVVTLPAALKQRDGRPKPLLVDAIQPPLPREVVDRPKRGFVLPFARWLRQELYNDVADTFLDTARLEELGLIPAAARSIWRNYLNRHDDLAWARPWALHALACWAHREGATL